MLSLEIVIVWYLQLLRHLQRDNNLMLSQKIVWY